MHPIISRTHSILREAPTRVVLKLHRTAAVVFETLRGTQLRLFERRQLPRNPCGLIDQSVHEPYPFSFDWKLSPNVKHKRIVESKKRDAHGSS